MAEETIFTWGAPPLKFGPGAADEVGFEMTGFGVRRVLIVTDPGVSALGAPQRIADAAIKRRLPLASAGRVYVEAGSLMSYAMNMVAVFRHAAEYTDRILRGANPADLPVEQPTRYELVFNLKTARALRLTIPPSVLQRADQFLE